MGERKQNKLTHKDFYELCKVAEDHAKIIQECETYEEVAALINEGGGRQIDHKQAKRVMDAVGLSLKAKEPPSLESRVAALEERIENALHGGQDGCNCALYQECLENRLDGSMDDMAKKVKELEDRLGRMSRQGGRDLGEIDAKIAALEDNLEAKGRELAQLRAIQNARPATIFPPVLPVKPCSPEQITIQDRHDAIM